MIELPASETVTFRQRLWFDSYRFQFDGNTSNNGQIRIQRQSDKKYWDDSQWVASETWNDTTTSTTDKEHRYGFDTNGEAGETIIVTMRVNNDEDTQDGDTFLIEDAQPSVDFG